MKYYKDGGFYDQEIHSEAMENWEEFISNAAEITDERWQELLQAQSRGCTIQPDENGNPIAVEPTPPTLEEHKARAINQLWYNYKNHQQTYVDAEDLTLATVCAAQGSEKGAAVQMWVMNLWGQYYAAKDAITAAESEEALKAIDLTATGEPPYTIRELNEDAKNLLTQKELQS